MSLHANIDHLAAAQGIEAVAVVRPATPREFRGDDNWNAVLEAALNLLQKTEESTIRLVIGKHTLVVQTEGEETVGVVLPTGHAIAKSLRRMIRRMSRKVRPPLTPPAPAPAAYVAPVAAPVAPPAAAAPVVAPVAPVAPAPAAAPPAMPATSPSEPAGTTTEPFSSPWG